jgi:hypothetical protein
VKAWTGKAGLGLPFTGFFNEAAQLSEESFELRFKVALRAFDEDDDVGIEVYFEEVGNEEELIKGRGQTFTFPRRRFSSTEERDKWIGATMHTFKQYISDAMMQEGRQHLTDSGNYHLAKTGIDPDPVDQRKLEEIHFGETGNRLMHYFHDLDYPHVPRPRARWTQAEIDRAVRLVFSSLKNEARTYERVAEILLEKYPDKAPTTGDALRKLLERLEINWKELKRTVKASEVSVFKVDS